MTIRIGGARVERVEDYAGPSFVPAEMFPAFRPEILEAERSWLVPRYYDPAAGRLCTSIHSWLLRTPRHLILVDSCIGNHKPRPLIERFNQRDVPWLERLAAAGARPEEVDFVLCTHLHADHVGWNTRLRDGRWVPTFPNARYLFSRTEFERWDPRRPGHRATAFGQNVFEDSILPVAEAGLMDLIEDGHELPGGVTVQAAPGHTPGHARIRLRSEGAEAIFSGDILHHPVQVPWPELCSVFDDDPVRGLATRRALLAEIAALLPHLDSLQRTLVAGAVRDMAAGRRRTA